MEDREREAFAADLSNKSKSLNTEAIRSRKRAKVALIIWRVCEYTAQISFLVGIVLLIVFAVFNTPCDSAIQPAMQN